MDSFNKIVKFSPFIGSENIGDHIIADYCDKQFEKIFGEHFSVLLSTRDKISLNSKRHIATSDYVFLCGTNLISSKMRSDAQWNISLGDILRVNSLVLRKRDLGNLKQIFQNIRKGHLILFGIGWREYQEKPDNYTIELLKLLLRKDVIHSVRDDYTKKKLESIGIKNVVNTACPTMWNLTYEFCKEIPRYKADKVITTITNYRMNYEEDCLLLDILNKCYDKVYVWLQSDEDFQFVSRYIKKTSVHIIPPTLNAFDSFLYNNNVDYVGTRLHGGIRALNHKKRTIIIAVDNRALEIGKDTNLPIINRSDVPYKLEDLINSNFSTQIKLPEKEIKEWKEQFHRKYKGNDFF